MRLVLLQQQYKNIHEEISHHLMLNAVIVDCDDDVAVWKENKQKRVYEWKRRRRGFLK